jgi:hypothetical protein
MTADGRVGGNPEGTSGRFMSVHERRLAVRFFKDR